LGRVAQVMDQPARHLSVDGGAIRGQKQWVQPNGGRGEARNAGKLHEGTGERDRGRADPSSKPPSGPAELTDAQFAPLTGR
jgi:hypothetical protein